MSRSRARDPRDDRPIEHLPSRSDRPASSRTSDYSPQTRRRRTVQPARSDDRVTSIPKLTRELADHLALMLHAGLEPFDALHYVLDIEQEEYSDERLKATAKAWAASPLLFDAVNRLNGGEWQSLDPQRRIEISLAKHYAEMARFLYTRTFSDALGPDLRKMIEARTALEAKIAGTHGTDDPLTKFARTVLGKMATEQGNKITPPQLSGLVETLPGRKPS